VSFHHKPLCQNGWMDWACFFDLGPTVSLFYIACEANWGISRNKCISLWSFVPNYYLFLLGLVSSTICQQNGIIHMSGPPWNEMGYKAILCHISAYFCCMFCVYVVCIFKKCCIYPVRIKKCCIKLTCPANLQMFTLHFVRLWYDFTMGKHELLFWLFD